MIVLERDGVVEVYGEMYGRASRDEFDRSYAHLVQSADDSWLHHTRLIALIHDDGTCTDPHGKVIDGGPFLMAYQLVQASRSAALGRRRPGKVYFSPIEDEEAQRFGVAADLIASIDRKVARDRILSLLFANQQFTQLYYIADMIEDILQELGVAYGCRRRELRPTGITEVVLTLPDEELARPLA